MNFFGESIVEPLSRSGYEDEEDVEEEEEIEGNVAVTPEIISIHPINQRDVGILLISSCEGSKYFLKSFFKKKEVEEEVKIYKNDLIRSRFYIWNLSKDVTVLECENINPEDAFHVCKSVFNSIRVGKR
jgi:hypothetical protein